MPNPLPRLWLSPVSQAREQAILATLGADVAAHIERLVEQNREIHDRDCINLNPATNVMNPRAEAVLASGLGNRPSLGHPGEKYEMGLEAIEQIEVLTASLACQIFRANYVEIRVGSGALANLYAFLATCKPGDAVIVPPPSIGGHITHNTAGVAGLIGLQIHEAPVNPATFSVDLTGLVELARRVRPRLITIGGSLNLLPHPVAEIKTIATSVGASLLFDAAHACGMIAGGVWPNPLDEGADLMTMSTYKSLGGPAGGLVLTNRADLAERIDAIAYPGITANFDVAKSASLAITLVDWVNHGAAYAQQMVATASVLAIALAERGLPVFGEQFGFTTSHQFAIDGTAFGGGHAAALRLRAANLLTCAIGLPGIEPFGGVRLGTPEIVRLGCVPDQMSELATIIDAGLKDPDPTSLAPQATAFRASLRGLRYID